MAYRVALATCDQYPGLVAEEQGLLVAFEKAGVAALPVSWSAPDVDWTSYALVVIRSVWDYHKRFPAFMAWLDRLDRQQVRVLNSLDLLKRNAHKTYLRAMENEGVSVVPTVWFDADATPDIGMVMDENEWHDAVLKPAVAASAYLTFRMSTQSAQAQACIERGMYQYGCMLQRFMPEVEEMGEWSIIFFNGHYSHSVLKRAAPGEYRIQSEYGGKSIFAAPPEALITQAHRASEFFGTTPLYARMDGLAVDGRFVLMEAELIEPYLFLETPELRMRFVEAVKQHL